MRVVVQRIREAAAILLAGSVLLSGQVVKSPPPRTQTEGKPAEIAPGNPPTAQEAEDAVKTPVRVEAMVTPAAVDPHKFIIGPEDILSIKVWKEPELSGAVQVRSDGKITMNLIGEIDAAGKTPEELKQKVILMLADYINKPDVTVAVQSVQSKKYYVAGEVNRTGAYQLILPTTVLQALITSGGFKDFANKKKIRIMRGGQILTFNYNEVVKGKNLQQNILLQAGDYIFVN